MEELKAYWPDRIPQLGICVVKQINFEDNKAIISNGHVRVYPKLDQITILRPTGITDSTGTKIYEFDYVQDEKNIYLVEWNQQQTCFWLNPVKSKVNEDFFIYVLNNQGLGNGYYSRKDLTIIGNKLTSEKEIENNEPAEDKS